MKCKGCGSEIDIESEKDKKVKIKRVNPSFYVKCPFCGAVNHVKCRHIKFKFRTVQGKRRKIKTGGIVKKVKII